MKSVLYLLLSNIILASSGGNEINLSYCGAKMCRNTNAHTFCQYPVGPSPQCLGYMRARLTTQEKQAIVGRLNRRRNDAASGKLQGLSSAANMMRLHWVEELALGAQRWADQCRPPRIPEENDACRDLFTITVGQAVASVVGDAPGLLVETMVDIWFLQNLYYGGIVTSYTAPSMNSSYYGDFAQMIWGRTYLVGCGRSRFMSMTGGRLRSVTRLVCNFAPRGPAARYPLWTPGAPASICPTQSVQDPELPSLCDFYVEDGKDMYYYNKFLKEDNITRAVEREIKIKKKYRRSNKRTTIQLIGRPKSYDIEDLLGTNEDTEDNDNNLDDSNPPRASTEVIIYDEPSQDDTVQKTRAPPDILSVSSDDLPKTEQVTEQDRNERSQINYTKIAKSLSEYMNLTSEDAIKEIIEEKIKKLVGVNHIRADIVEEKEPQNIKANDLKAVVTAPELLPKYNNTTRVGKVRRELKTIYEHEKTTTTIADINKIIISNKLDDVTELIKVNMTTIPKSNKTVDNRNVNKTNSTDYNDGDDDEQAEETTAGTEDEVVEDEDVKVSTESTFAMILRFMPVLNPQTEHNTTLVKKLQKNRAMPVSPGFILLLTCVL